MAVRQTEGLQAHLRNALDNMPGALVYTDEELNIVFCNDRSRRCTGCRRSCFSPAGPTPTSCATGRERLLRQGRPRAWSRSVSRACAIRRAGASRTTRRTAAGIASAAAGSPAGGTVTVMTDITEQKQAERTLADKEAQLHVALDNMPGALVYTDDHLNIVVLQRSLQGDVRGAAGAASTRPPVSRFPALPGRERLLRRRRRRRAGRRRVREPAQPTGKSFEDHAPDGRWYRILRRRVAAGGTVTVMTDITEQKQAERELLDATRRTEEANKLITEKNRMLEALYSEIRTRTARWRSRRRRSPNGMRGSKRASPSRWRRSGRCPSSRGFSRRRSAT